MGELTYSEDIVRLIVSHSGSNFEIDTPTTVTLGELQVELEELTEIPPSYQKLMIPKFGVAKPEDGNKQLKDVLPEHVLRSTKPTKLMLIGTKPALADMIKSLVSKPRLVRNPRISSVARNANKKRAPDVADLTYTFQKLVPLPFLPHPEMALEYLERLKADKGIQGIMKKYKWSVSILTELDPASNMTHDGKLLGLNRNKGEVIELRLRTDEYQGWRDYKTVRRTLCHELAHNVYSPGHPPEFWALTKKLELEAVELNPFGHGGNKLSNEEFYQPPEEEEYQDDGGWEGGVFVLGSGDGSNTSGGLMTTEDARRLTPRELILRAAEQRNTTKWKKDDHSSSSSPGQSAI
ncbi:WLM domain-containing protein [Lipomyces arxii]|uniref:WLM domain-containing protein n=1 Tax=Lipomyces arxii TaxID=56418 RepID=UPI0034CF47AD